MVREAGLEPARPRTLEPKSSASTNSATRACPISLAETVLILPISYFLCGTNQQTTGNIPDTKLCTKVRLAGG